MEDPEGMERTALGVDMGALAYRLFWDTKHLKRNDDDAILVPFKGKEYVCGWIGTEPLEVPNPVLFEANFKVTSQSDYPCNDVNWPIMSPRMIDVLRSVGDFPHRLVPVRLMNRKVREPLRYLPDGSLRPEVIDDRFVAMQLTEHIDIVDWERSVFERDQIAPGVVFYSFDKLVLREPPGGFPPLFRIPANSGPLFISVEGRRALENAAIRGVLFDDLPDRVNHGSD
jgi:hypothetical protein